MQYRNYSYQDAIALDEVMSEEKAQSMVSERHSVVCLLPSRCAKDDIDWGDRGEVGC